MHQQIYLTTVQAAHFLALHPDTLRSWRKQEKGPACIKLGTRYRYRREALDAFLESTAE
jgi:excisionase family DNA binding protein